MKVGPAGKSEALVEQSAGTVGVFYSPEFRNYVGSDKFTVNGDIMQVPLGEPSVAMFDDALARLFQKVSLLAEWPIGEPMAAGVDLVILPQIESFSIQFPRAGVGYRVSVGYAIGLYSPAGSELANWRLVGYGDVERHVLLSRGSHWEAALGMALRDSAAQLLVRMSTHPAVTAQVRHGRSKLGP